jgi:DNA polymerase III delta prime subunit
MTRDELIEYLIEQGMDRLAHYAAGEFDIDQLPALHPFAAEWVQQHLADRTEAPWLILVGPVGCGKTSQSLAAARYLIGEYARRYLRQMEWRFVAHRDFAARVQRGGETDADQVLQHFAETKDLLIFSDLGDFNPQDFGRAASYTAQLINHRYHYALPTIYETNLLYRRTPEVERLEQDNGLSIATLDRLLDDRAIDRLMAGWTAPLPEINYRRSRGRVMGT